MSMKEVRRCKGCSMPYESRLQLMGEVEGLRFALERCLESMTCRCNGLETGWENVCAMCAALHRLRRHNVNRAFQSTIELDPARRVNASDGSGATEK